MEGYPPDYNASGIRAPSPTSSLGSTYPEDQTAESDTEEVCPQVQFEAKWEARIGLGKKREDEEQREKEPLLERPKTPNSEREMHDTVMNNLRAAISRLREEDVFERNSARATSAPLHQQTSASDVDSILQSMMPQQAGSFRGIEGNEEESLTQTNGSLSTAGGRRS